MRNPNYISRGQFFGSGGNDSFVPSSDFPTPDEEITPLSIPSLEAWYRIPSEVGFVNNNTLPVITDFSGKGKHLLKASALGAVYKTNSLNGLPGLLFSNTESYTSTNGKADTDFLHKGPSTMIMVLKSTADNLVNPILDTCNRSGGANIGRFLEFGVNAGNGAFYDVIYNGVDDFVSGGTTDPGSAPKDVPLVFCITFEPDIATDDYRNEINNVIQQYKERLGLPSASTSTNAPTWFVNNAYTQLFQGYMYEIQLYSARLTDIQRRSLIGGLNVYGL